MGPFEKLMGGFDSEIFNLGADEERTILNAAKIVQTIAKEFGFDADIKFFEKRNEVHTAYCSQEKAKNILDFKDETIFEDTVREMFSWALTQPNREVQNFEYEISKNLYSFWK